MTATWDEARAWRERRREQGRAVVFTNGCFDILHAGHLDLFNRARSFGDALVVAVNSDGSVRRLKGAGRPLVPLSERAALVAALKPVDLVVTFDDHTPLRLIEQLRPDVIVKGGDWAEDDVVGRDVVEAAGGRVEIVPLVERRSTTGLIEEIVRRYGRDD